MTITITSGWVGRHTPPNAGAGGRDAAIIDIAQDLLLRELRERGALDALVFKGGTALRKLYAGTQGRFSTDLDFSLADAHDAPEDVEIALVTEIDGIALGPFTYSTRERRGKWSLVVESPFGGGDSALLSKIDVSPAVWMNPVQRSWVPMPIHQAYGQPPLPHLQAIRMEENLAEKISRLNRTTTARDMYDLAWIMEHRHEVGGLDLDLVRRLAILKIWVDANGLAGGNAAWKPGHETAAFEPERWLRPRTDDEFDLEDIGSLTVPTPTAEDLSVAVRTKYGFLADLNPDELTLAAARGRDRGLALQALLALPDGRLNGLGIY